MKKENEGRFKLETKDAKIFSIEDDSSMHRLMKMENEFIQIREERINPKVLDSLIQKGKAIGFAEELGINWIYNAFKFPEFIINSETIKQIIRENISDPLELVLRFLIQEELQNDITPRLFLDKVLNNKVVNTEKRFTTVCEIIKSATNVFKILDEIETPMIKLITNMNYRDIWQKFYKADIKVDMDETQESLQDKWNNIEISYSGEPELPEGTKVISTRHELKRYFFLDKETADMYWEKMVNRKIFILKTFDSKVGNILFPVKNYTNTGVFNLSGPLSNPFDEMVVNDCYVELWQNIVKRKNQDFFLNNFKEDKIVPFDGNEDLQKLLDTL